MSGFAPAGDADPSAGESPMDGRTRRPPGAEGADGVPAWDDIDAWRSLLAEAATLEARRAVVARRAGAAGGRAAGLALALPPDLRPGLALAELRTQARMVGLEVLP